MTICWMKGYIVYWILLHQSHIKKSLWNESTERIGVNDFTWSKSGLNLHTIHCALSGGGITLKFQPLEIHSRLSPKLFTWSLPQAAMHSSSCSSLKPWSHHPVFLSAPYLNHQLICLLCLQNISRIWLFPPISTTITPVQVSRYLTWIIMQSTSLTSLLPPKFPQQSSLSRAARMIYWKVMSDHITYLLRIPQ